MGTLQTFASVYTIKDVDREIQRDYMKNVKVLWKSLKFGAFTYLVEVTDSKTGEVFAMFDIMKVSWKKGEWYSVKAMDENCMPYYGEASLKALKMAEGYRFDRINEYGAQWRRIQYNKFKRADIPKELIDKGAL